MLAALLYLASRARRLGPAEDEARELPPARRVYVDALGAALARTRDRAEAAAPVQAAARQRVAERASLGPDPGDEELIAAAEKLGLSPERSRAVAEPMRDDDDVMLAGAALAQLRRDGDEGTARPRDRGGVARSWWARTTWSR